MEIPGEAQLRNSSCQRKPYGRIKAFGAAGYGVLGSSSEIPLRNVFCGSLGGAYTADERTSAG
jgi:hypothetical protein